MNSINWAQVLTGAAVGLLVAVLLVDPIKAARDRVFYRLRRRIRRIVRALRSDFPVARELFTFGSVETSWMVLDGDGRQNYIGVECIRIEPPLQLPEGLVELKTAIAREQAERRARGEHSFWNGKVLALYSYSPDRIGDEEKPIIRLRFRESDYYNFLASSLSMDRTLPDGATVRQKYLSHPNWEKPAESLSSSFGINVALVTADNKLVVIRRGSGVGSMPGAYGTSINEGLNVADMSPSGIDVFACGRRGSLEELGFDLPKQDIHYFSLGVDTALAQWGLLGIVRLKDARYDQIVAIRAKGAKDKFEADTMESIDFTPDAVERFVREHPHWAPGGLACVYHALVNEYGQADVEKSIANSKKKAGQFAERSR